MPQATARSPIAGCTIMLAALGVMAFVLAFSIWSLLKLDSEIDKFTANHRRPLPVAATAGAEAALNGLMARLEVFRTDLDADPPRRADLALTAADLNHAIAAFDGLRELRGSLHVAAVEQDHLVLEVSFPMNTRPFSGGSRFLNATLVARPELHPGEVVLQIDEIRVPNASVPEEFRGHLSPYRPLERLRDHPLLGPAMQRLTGIEVRAGAVHLRSDPAEPPPAAVSEAQGAAASSRLLKGLALAASAFLLVAGTLVFFSLRHAARRKGSDDSPRL